MYIICAERCINWSFYGSFPLLLLFPATSSSLNVIIVGAIVAGVIVVIVLLALGLKVKARAKGNTSLIIKKIANEH